MLARSAAPLVTIVAITSRDEGLENPDEYAGDWRVIESSGSFLADDAAAMLVELVEQTGAPAMTGFVMDSDCVDLYAYGNKSGLWRACLARSAMAGYLADEQEPPIQETYPEPGDAADRAVAWAVEAGLVPDHRGLVELFGRVGDDLVAESEFDELLYLLGIHRRANDRRQRPDPFEPAIEQRLESFIRATAATTLSAAGYTKREERFFQLENENGDRSLIAFFPFHPGFIIHALVLHKGRTFYPRAREQALVDIMYSPGNGVATWERSWFTTDVGAVWALEPNGSMNGDLLTRFEHTMRDIIRSITGLFDRTAFIDILNGHGADNLSQNYYNWLGPGALGKLQVLFESNPGFALADALWEAENETEAWCTQSAEMVEFIQRRLEASDPSWRTESQQVKSQLREMLDEYVSPQLTAIGYTLTPAGYERTTPYGSTIRLDIGLSATSSHNRIAFYVHVGLLLHTQTAWYDYRVTRFHPHFPHPHNAQLGWFNTTRDPNPEFSADDEGLALLQLCPWFFEPTTAAAVGRQLASVLTEEANRLSPLLDRTTLVTALTDAGAGFEPIILALLPAGRSELLEENLRRAEADPDPDNYDLAEWARSQLTLNDPT